MITYLGWGVIGTLIFNAFTIGEAFVVKEKYAEKVFLISAVLQVIVMIALVFGTKNTMNFAFGQVLTYVGVFVLVGGWIKSKDIAEKIKEKREK